jgi:hypothetical protein
VTADDPTNWILTGSLENFRINVERGFDVIGFKEGRRRQAEEFEPGDEIFFYVTGVQAFGGIARVPAEQLATELEHVRKWPLEHWHLAFQGQLRTIGETDARLLRERMEASTAATNTAAGSTAARA